MAGANTKKFNVNIQLINSVIKDDAGNTISLTSDERLSVSYASGGPATQANPLTSKMYVDEAINSAVTAAVDGLSWRKPVNTVAATAPLTPVNGERYLNTTDDKIYTYETDTWVGIAPQANWAVYVMDSDEEYTYNADTGEWVMKSAGAIPDATTLVKGKVVIGDNITVENGKISVATASDSVKGVVQFAADGEVAALKAVQSNDARLLKGRYAANFVGVTNFEVPHGLGSQKLFVQVWEGNEQIEAYVAKKTGEEAQTLQIGLNQSATVDVVVIALP